MMKFFILLNFLLNSILGIIPVFNEEDFRSFLTEYDIVVASICFNRWY